MRELCLIVSGGELCPLPEALRAAQYVIACDRGYAYAAQWGIKPDLVIGDFDSAAPPTGVPIERVPTR